MPEERAGKKIYIIRSCVTYNCGKPFYAPQGEASASICSACRRQTIVTDEGEAKDPPEDAA